MTNNLLEWELQWIDDHSDLYNNPEMVKKRITDRYFIKDVIIAIKRFEADRTTGSMFKLFNYMNQPLS